MTDTMSTTPPQQTALPGTLATDPAVRPAWTFRGWAEHLKLHRDLLAALVQREIKVRYKQSIMGFLWAILMPALIVGAGVIVKVAMAKLAGSSVSLDSLALVTVKAVPWAFFAATVKLSSTSLIANSNLVTKIYTPREVFPFAAVAAQSFDFLIGAVVLILLLPLFHLDLGARLLLVPVFVVELILLTAALALFLSAASLFFRDVKYLVEVFVTFGIFFTPVFYEATMFDKWSSLILLNPVAPILEGIGTAVVGGPFIATGWFIYSAVFAIVGFIVALIAFKRMEPYFAESV